MRPFTGQYFYSIDKKCRLTVPQRLREGIDPKFDGYGLVACVGYDGLLYLYTPAAYEQVTPRFDVKAQTSADVRNYVRLTHGLKEDLEVDRLGRVLIPSSLLKQFGLAGEVALVGAGDHIEVWPRERWNTFVQEQLGKRDETAAKAIAFAQPSAPAVVPPAAAGPPAGST